MAHMTVEQANTLRALKAQYGLPLFVKIEYTEGAYGVVWAQWPHERLGQRNLFVRHDGTRLSWSTLESRPSEDKEEPSPEDLDDTQTAALYVLGYMRNAVLVKKWRSALLPLKHLGTLLALVAIKEDAEFAPPIIYRRDDDETQQD